MLSCRVLVAAFLSLELWLYVSSSTGQRLGLRPLDNHALRYGCMDVSPIIASKLTSQQICTRFYQLSSLLSSISTPHFTKPKQNYFGFGKPNLRTPFFGLTRVRASCVFGYNMPPTPKFARINNVMLLQERDDRWDLIF